MRKDGGVVQLLEERGSAMRQLATRKSKRQDCIFCRGGISHEACRSSAPSGKPLLKEEALPPLPPEKQRCRIYSGDGFVGTCIEDRE